jgi:hypothetical protein
MIRLQTAITDESVEVGELLCEIAAMTDESVKVGEILYEVYPLLRPLVN